jgi:hypothetical protein
MDLLHILLDGSIHLKRTDVWKAVEALKEQMAGEKQGLIAKRDALQEENERKKEALRNERAEKEAAERQLQIESQKARAEKEAAERQRQIESQKALHTHSYPRVHQHSLARTQDLILKGSCRADGANCDQCVNGWFQRARCVWTCEACDFDICQHCFDNTNMSEAEVHMRRVEEGNAVMQKLVRGLRKRNDELVRGMRKCDDEQKSFAKRKSAKVI